MTPPYCGRNAERHPLSAICGKQVPLAMWALERTAKSRRSTGLNDRISCGRHISERDFTLWRDAPGKLSRLLPPGIHSGQQKQTAVALVGPSWDESRIPAIVENPLSPVKLAAVSFNTDPGTKSTAGSGRSDLFSPDP